jgi:hypothetical protein
VIPNRQEQGDGEEVEEVVVPGEDNEELQSKLEESPDTAREGEGSDEKEGERDLHEKSEDHTKAEDERMELMEEPGHGVREALGGKVILQIVRQKGRGEGGGAGSSMVPPEQSI